MPARHCWSGLNLPQTSFAGGGQHGVGGSGQRVVMVIFGGVRRAETFSAEGLQNIPHLSQDLLPQSLFYPNARNDGVTAHFNAISSILTGNWQRVDDWGKLAPTTPTLFEHFRKQLGAAQSDTWVVASNKALTNLIGASSASGVWAEVWGECRFPEATDGSGGGKRAASGTARKPGGSRKDRDGIRKHAGGWELRRPGMERFRCGGPAGSAGARNNSGGHHDVCDERAGRRRATSLPSWSAAK